MNLPAKVYAERLAERREAAERLRLKDGKIGSAGLWCVFILVLLAAVRIVVEFPIAVLAIPLAVAVVIQRIHARLDGKLRVRDHGVRHYEGGLARIGDRWAGSGRTGEEFGSPDHPYAADLDLFGRGSLFELLCTVHSRSGEKTLAGWLLDPADPSEIRERQAAVSELRERLDLREELALLSGEARSAVKPDALAAWGGAPAVLTGAWLRPTAVLLTVLSIATLLVWLLSPLGVLPFVATLFLIITFSRATRGPVQEAVSVAEEAERELDTLSSILARLEREPFSSPRLVALKERLTSGGEPASAVIARLARRVQFLQSVRNELIQAVAGLFLWRVHCAFSIETWRRAHGPSISGWISAVGEMEALAALSTYAYEHPDDPFPEILDGGPAVEGEQLGHPLIPGETCVRNDIRLGEKTGVLLVSGSNMSGKSTLLRTVGTNAILAFAGGPVRARRLALSAFSIGATIRLQDSLQAGTSRFYAEITRLKRLMDMTEGPRPLLFLLEEVLHGTNSHDRRTGTELILRAFLDRGAIGLVTTHDLALADAVDQLDGRGGNVHFQDEMKDGKLYFDYVLRPGVVEKSNALELMRAVGLPVTAANPKSESRNPK